MKRINVIGTTGSGKSTFSKQLAETLHYPYIQMDRLFWKPNWTLSEDAEFFPKVEQAVNGESWVLDGNYTRTNPIKWQQVDTIIWLDFSYFRTFLQLLKRTISRAVTQQELWPETGNHETFYKSFLSRESIFIWFFECYKKNKADYAELMNSPPRSHIQCIRLANPNEVKHFLERIQ